VLAGFENHGGRTSLGTGQAPLGRVLHGNGNDGRTGFEGARRGNTIGTYLHGPLLPKNVWFADWLIARALGIAERVGAPQQLVAAANAEHDRIAIGRLVQRVSLELEQVLSAQPLIAVLAAADVEQVVRVGVERLAEPGRGELEAKPTPATAPLEHEQVAAVCVDVHQIRIERADAQRARRPGCATVGIRHA